MPNRIIRDAILTSEPVASLGWPEEVFYRRLMSIVDDYGRSEAGHQLLRARCYPLQTDSVRTADISRWLAACQKAGLILGYTVNGKEYLEISKFGQQQRSPSKSPSPLASAINCAQVPADAHLGVSVSVSEGVVGPADAAKPSRKKPRTALPEDFAPSETGRRVCLEAGFSASDEVAKFKNHHTAQGTLMADWQAGFRTWIDKGKEFRKPGRASPTSTVPSSNIPDPALAKLDRERLTTKGPSLDTLARMAELRKAAH